MFINGHALHCTQWFLGYLRYLQRKTPEQLKVDTYMLVSFLLFTYVGKIIHFTAQQSTATGFLKAAEGKTSCFHVIFMPKCSIFNATINAKHICIYHI